MGVISSTTKSVVDALVVKVKAIVASLVVDPSLTPVVVLVIAMVGDTVSITMSLLTAKEPAAPIAGSVKELHLMRHLLWFLN